MAKADTDWLTWCCALCGDPFDTVRHGMFESALPCPCETRKPHDPVAEADEAERIRQLMFTVTKEAAARRAAKDSLP